MVIAEYDATAHKMPPGIDIQGYPTLLFFPAQPTAVQRALEQGVTQEPASATPSPGSAAAEAAGGGERRAALPVAKKMSTLYQGRRELKDMAAFVRTHAVRLALRLARGA